MTCCQQKDYDVILILTFINDSNLYVLLPLKISFSLFKGKAARHTCLREAASA
jgi:hypothetical protein